MKKGSTLIELLIYIALVSGIALTSVMFVTNLIQSRVKSVLQENVAHNARLSMRRLESEIRQSTSITSVTDTDLCLVSPTLGRNPTRIYLNSGRLYIGWGGSCTTPTSSYPLTSASVTVSNLKFSNSTASSAKTVDYTYKISGNITSGRQEWLYDTVASGSATLR